MRVCCTKGVRLYVNLGTLICGADSCNSADEDERRLRITPFSAEVMNASLHTDVMRALAALHQIPAPSLQVVTVADYKAVLRSHPCSARLNDQFSRFMAKGNLAAVPYSR